MLPGSSGSGANDAMSGGDATEYNCGVVGVIGVLALLDVATRTFDGFSSLPLNSRDRFGTLPYLTAGFGFIKRHEHNCQIGKRRERDVMK